MAATGTGRRVDTHDEPVTVAVCAFCGANFTPAKYCPTDEAMHMTQPMPWCGTCFYYTD